MSLKYMKYMDLDASIALTLVMPKKLWNFCNYYIKKYIVC